MPFAGMMGRMLAQTMIRQRVANAAKDAVNQGGGYRGAFQSSGKYLFVAHPNCCPKCTQMNGTLWNTPDVAFISHPNCKCATIEAPAGLSPAELMAWTKSPVGVMRFGFNYGSSLKPVQLTVENRDKVYAQWHERMDPESVKAHPRRLVRAKVSQAQIDAIRAKVKSGELTQGTDLTRRVEGFARAAITRQNKRRAAQKLEELRTVSEKLRKGDVWNPNGNKANRLYAKIKNQKSVPTVFKKLSENAAAGNAVRPNPPSSSLAGLRAAARSLGLSRSTAQKRAKDAKERQQIERAVNAVRESAKRRFMSNKRKRR